MKNPTATQQIRDLQRLISEVQKALAQLQKLLDTTQGNERAKYKLIVTMPDGEKIQEKKPSETHQNLTLPTQAPPSRLLSKYLPKA